MMLSSGSGRVARINGRASDSIEVRAIQTAHKQRDEDIQPPFYTEVNCHDDKSGANGGLWSNRFIVTIPRGWGFVLKPKQFSWYIKEEDHEADLEIGQCNIRYDNQQGALVPLVNQRSLEMAIEELLGLPTWRIWLSEAKERSEQMYHRCSGTKVW